MKYEFCHNTGFETTEVLFVRKCGNRDTDCCLSGGKVFNLFQSFLVACVLWMLKMSARNLRPYELFSRIRGVLQLMYLNLWRRRYKNSLAVCSIIR